MSKTFLLYLHSTTHVTNPVKSTFLLDLREGIETGNKGTVIRCNGSLTEMSLGSY